MFGSKLLPLGRRTDKEVGRRKGGCCHGKHGENASIIHAHFSAVALFARRHSTLIRMENSSSSDGGNE
jgi:hypothetical protein